MHGRFFSNFFQRATTSLVIIIASFQKNPKNQILVYITQYTYQNIRQNVNLP